MILFAPMIKDLDTRNDLLVYPTTDWEANKLLQVPQENRHLTTYSIDSVGARASTLKRGMKNIDIVTIRSEAHIA